MAALLGVNFGSQKHAYFQTRITIHELTNVPMVAGHFKAKWKVDHSHNLASAIASASASASASTSTSTNTNVTSENHHANHTKQQQQQQQLLNHRKSTSTLSSSFDRDENGSIRSESIRKAHHRSGDDASSTYSNSHKPKRKSSYRIFSGIRDALKPHSSSNPSSISTSRNAKSSRESQDERPSIDSRSDDGSEEASEVLADHHHHDRESSQQSNNSSNSNNHHSQQQANHHHHHHHSQSVLNNHLHYDPRGETSGANVKDNRVVWEKQINVGVRFNVEKPRQVSGGSHSGASLSEQAATNNSRSTDATMRRSLSQKDVHGNSSGGILQHDSSGVSTPRDTSSWSMLAPSELRISVKADVPTGIEGNHADHQTMMKFGHVSINLAEFAPHPHLHHHHHHHHSHHHHQSYSSGRPGVPHSSHSDHHHVLSRTETRRYLLLDGPTNATVKVTVEMKHVGGTREYQVPSNKRGLLVGSIVPTLDGSSPTGSKGPSSYAGSEADDAASSNGGSAEHTNSDSHAARSTSVTKALSDWSPHSVARHSRIPEENLRTKLTHKDTARAVKEAGGGGRLAFSFAAGAHHDRPPESVIDSIFDSNMLTPTPSRDKKASSQQKQQQRQGQEKPEQTPKARDMASKHLSIAGQSAKSRNSSGSSKSGGIRWDVSVEKAKSSPTSIPESGLEESTPRSTKTSNESDQVPESSRANPLSSSKRKEDHDAKTFGEDKYRSHLPLQPPKTPPDIVRNDELSKVHPPLDYPPPWSETSTATETPPTSPSLHKKQSRRTLGLTKEAAMMAGYKGAGWGTLELSKHASNLSLDSSDSGSEHGNHSILHHHHRSPTFAYLHERTRSPSPSPLQQLAH